jgi:hypothetical protein
MHGSLDRSGETDNSVNWPRRIAPFALPVLVAIALIGLALTNPSPSDWVPEAVRAELTGANYGPEIVPTEVAQPPSEKRTARAN